MAYQRKQGWPDDPRLLNHAFEACKAEHSSDRLISRFYFQLKYARPTNANASGAGSSTAAMAASIDAFLSVTKQIGFNVFQEVTDACTAKICQPLRPRVVPVAAKPDIARDCTLLSRLQDGVMDACNFIGEATLAWDDSYCIPNGYVFFEIDEEVKEIIARRVDPRGVFYHRSEGRHPVHLYFEEPMSKEVLAARYPDMEAEIVTSPTWRPEVLIGVDPPQSGEVDTVCVRRAWRRRTGEESGRFVISVNGHVLNGEPESGVRKGEPWDYDFFPFAVFRNRFDFNGFGGVPGGRILAPYHLSINELARIAKDSFKGAVPVVWSHKLSKLDELSDVPYQVGKWEGQYKPEVAASNPVSQQVLAEREFQYNKAYEAFGINRAVASGQAPKGVVAAVAMREVIGLADARAAEFQKHWESGWRQAGHIIVAFARELKKLRVRSSDPNSELMEELDLSKIRIDRTDYKISYGLTSALSKSIPGLMSDLNEFKDMGLIDAVSMAQAIGDKVPDIAADIDRITAAHRLAAKQVQTAIETGEIPEPPSPAQGQQGLDAGLLLCQQAYCSAKLNPERYSPENFEALRRLTKLFAAKKAGPTPTQATVTPGAAINPNALTTIGAPAPVAAPPQPAMGA